MLASYTQEEVRRASSSELAEALETGHIVHFPRCPFALPEESELRFLREELPQHIRLKNVSYHPEADRVLGIKADAASIQRVHRILTEHASRVQTFLRAQMPGLCRDWTVGTTSFRPIQERGRNLEPHASNELVHIDAGAYGATDGDRILRFFVNVNPREDRVWATKGSFPELYSRWADRAGIRPAQRTSGYLRKGPLDHLRSGFLSGLSHLGLPQARVIDSSPYDRVMRRFHNFMKDSAEFVASREDYAEMRFAPFSAWMVLTDMVSHASLSGQHALVSTFLLRLENCSRPELAPINVLRTH